MEREQEQAPEKEEERDPERETEQKSKMEREQEQAPEKEEERDPEKEEERAPERETEQKSEMERDQERASEVTKREQERGSEDDTGGKETTTPVTSPIGPHATFNEDIKGQEHVAGVIKKTRIRPAKLILKNTPDLKNTPAHSERKRKTSCMWDLEFDQYQVFEVEHESCLDFEITIKKGEAITKGSRLKDFVDTPDPYVIMQIRGCSNSSKRTSHIDNCTNPIWDESFLFYLDPADEHILKVTLMDANLTMDDTLGEDTFCINELTNDQPIDHTFIFPGGSKVHATLKLQKNKNPDLRFSLALCQAEKEFLMTRRKKVLVSMQNLLGNKAPNTEEQVPIMGILGSGGGFRAMTCLSGAVKALHEMGILDCTTYIAGLSGSSWYISTLYAHDMFPNVTHSQIQSELRESVTTNWKWQLRKSTTYIGHMIAKYKRGQPVSFTDFFGHLLGDVLLKGKKHKKLTDMRKILVQGIMPMPLFCCLHAKRNVSCRSFSEWVEFSPYEIGIAKYGTFLKTEDFGNKFIVGKKIKNFEELPLHFLQGVWGSAFTILFKRLIMEGGKKDIVQIMRDAQQETEADIHDKLNEEHSSGDDSDTEDEEYIEGRDDIEDEDSDGVDTTEKLTIEPHTKSDHFSNENSIPEGEVHKPNRRLSEVQKGKSIDTATPTLRAQSSHNQHERLSRSFDCLSLDGLENCKEKNISNRDEEEGQEFIAKMNKGFSFNLYEQNTSNDDSRKHSTVSDPGGNTDYQSSRLSRKGAMKVSRVRKNGTTGESQQSQNLKEGSANNLWADKRKSQRKNRAEKKAGMWEGLKQSIMTGTNILNSRAGRAGEVLNPFRGLSLRHSFPISPFATDDLQEEEEDELDALMDFGKGCRYEALDNKAKKLFIVDSGLSFNSPFPLLLRPQRAVDIYLSFDFSERPEDKHHPFKQLFLAEKWAIQNKVPFPPIQNLVAEIKHEEVRECYVFKHPSDLFCPVILHFPLVNNKFKDFKAPGVPRTTEEEKNFANFPIFDDPNNPYSSMNFVYESIQFDRLTQLVEFNTLSCMDIIKKELEELVQRKKQYLPTPLSITDVVNTMKLFARKRKDSNTCNLKLKLSLENELQLKNYVRKSQGMDRQESIDSSESDYADALEEQPGELGDS